MPDERFVSVKAEREVGSFLKIFQAPRTSTMITPIPIIEYSGRTTNHAIIIVPPPRTSVRMNAISPVPNPIIVPRSGINFPSIGRREKNILHPMKSTRRPSPRNTHVIQSFSVRIDSNIASAVRSPISRRVV